MEEIKNCPFCNSEAYLYSGEFSDSNEIVYEVKCKNEDCYLADGADWNMNSKEEALNEWNKSITNYKILDYDRIELDYSAIVDHATNGLLSKTNYDVSTLYSVIDDRQREDYYSFILDDIENFETVKEIKEYLKSLSGKNN